MDTPTVGRIVHVVTDGKCRAAIVTDTDDVPDRMYIDAAVFEPMGTRNLMGLHYRGTPVQKQDQTWHWPERD